MRRSILAALALLATRDLAAQTETGPIGIATMLPDGTIVLDLRAEAPGGTVGQGRLTYPPGHPEYAAVLRHLGGLRPDEVKSVRPWD